MQLKELVTVPPVLGVHAQRYETSGGTGEVPYAARKRNDRIQFVDTLNVGKLTADTARIGMPSTEAGAGSPAASDSAIACLSSGSSSAIGPSSTRAAECRACRRGLRAAAARLAAARRGCSLLASPRDSRAGRGGSGRARSLDASMLRPSGRVQPRRLGPSRKADARLGSPLSLSLSLSRSLARSL